MVSWWVLDSYWNTKKIQIGDIVMIISAYGLSGSFVSRLGSKSIGHSTYIGRRTNLRLKKTPIHGTVHKYDLNHSYSRSHVSRLSQAVAKK